MICSNLHHLTGFECRPIGDGGELAYIVTPFKFNDGDRLPVYVEKSAAGFRFFDDGQTLLHFMGRGMKFNSGHQLKFLSNIAQHHGVTLNEDGILEVFAANEEPNKAFARYISCMLQLVEWEREHEDLDANASAFSTEVAEALRAWQPLQAITSTRDYIGASGKTHSVDFQFGNRGVLAVAPKPQKTAHVLYKLVDIRSKTSNSADEFLVVIDDRQQPDKARNEAEVFRTVANVMTFTKLKSLKTVDHGLVQ